MQQKEHTASPLSHRIRPTAVATLLGFISLGLINVAAAHISAAELSNMSLEDLLTIRTRENQHIASPSKWRFRYQHIYRSQSGYKRGTKNISIDEVLLDGIKPRTATNFPIAVKKISQYAEQLSLQYQLSETSQLAISSSYIHQSTQHTSIIPAYKQFKISTSGWGDTSVNVSHQAWRSGAHSVLANIGLSFPTGSIDETGDTPRAPGQQILPYSMQLGSGTYDVPLGLIYQHRLTNFTYGGHFSCRIRTGTNKRNYRLGKQTRFDLWASYKPDSRFSPSIRLALREQDPIKGADKALAVPSPAGFIYPVSMTNPAYYERSDLRLHAGITMKLPNARGKPAIKATLELIDPLYQKVTGVQPSEQTSASLSLSIPF